MEKSRPIAPVTPLSSEQLSYHPVGLESASITSGVWAKWQRDNRSSTIPHSFAWLEKDGTIDNLRRLDPSAQTTTERRGLWFTDSDLYKAIEGVAWELGREPSEALDTLLTRTTRVIARAQQPDGYINSFVQAGLDVRWDNLVKSHELYCIGHLIQAGIAHKRSTGRSELFDVAIKAADVIVQDFARYRRGDTDGHEEIEMALVELYRETQNVEYLDLAKQFIDVRGYQVLDPKGHADSDYYQDSVPVREETTVTGHAVRAVYLLVGVVDLYIETGEEALLTAALTQWESMTATKTYITGAIGSRFVGEAFGDSYELPPDLAYGETCATIGNIMLSWRLLLATGEARFADAIERGMYNLLSASTSVDRTGFFYNNPAQRRRPQPASVAGVRPTRADAPGTRPEWFECACCPPNIIRTIASLGAYLGSYSKNSIQIHQFTSSAINFPIEDGSVRLSMETNYPINGDVRITIASTPASEWTLAIRKPEWADEVTIAINGTTLDCEVNRYGYVEVSREWAAGDEVSCQIPMQPRLTVAHPAVDALRGTVAIERGPILYALEGIDHEGIDLNAVEIDTAAAIVERYESDFLGQETVLLDISGVIRDDAAWAASGWASAAEPPSVSRHSVELTAIPYALWANRGPSSMRIFVPTKPAPLHLT